MFDYPILDPRNEDLLTQQAKSYAFQRSNGIINDFTEAGALDTLIRSQAYTGAELLSYVNLLPLSVAFKVLEFAGVEKREGTKSTALVQFELIVPSVGLYTIPVGFEVQSTRLGDQLQFLTTQVLEIPPGSITGTVPVEAQKIGSKYNIAAGQIDRFITPLSGLKSVINLEPSRGGTDAESSDSLLTRARQAIRRRAPISVIDYEEYAEELMGGGIAKCIPALSEDKNNSEPGAAHVFLVSPDGSPANIALINKVKSDLGKLVHIGTKLYVSAMNVLEVDGYIIGQLIADIDPSTVANNLWTTFQEFFNFDNYLPGESVIISELQTQLRLTEGLKFIEFVSVNESAVPFPVTNSYTMPIPMSLKVELVTATGSIYRTTLGMGIPMD
jgi:uncharacterized phage protein gp47/JayE